MRTLTAAAVAALASPSCKLTQLVHMELDSAPLCLNTSAWDLEYDGNTYLGTHGGGAIEVISDAPGEVKPLRFTMPGISSDDLALVLLEEVQGRAVTVYTAIFEAGSLTIADAVVEWAGRLDTMTIDEDPASGRSTVTVTAEHVGVDLLRPSNLLFSNQDQQRLFPGDRFFEFVVDQADQPVVWPAASYFKR